MVSDIKLGRHGIQYALHRRSVVESFIPVSQLFMHAESELTCSRDARAHCVIRPYLCSQCSASWKNVIIHDTGCRSIPFH